MTEYLTTKELAALLRIKERKVYDLAASGAVPCSKAMGKLLFPREAVEAWLAQGQSGSAVPPAVMLGSHDPLLDWALRESRCGIASYVDGSMDGLERFARREGIAAGLHLREGDGWNVAAVRARCAGMPVVLVEWARRARGLILGDRAGKVRGIGDLPGHRVVPRQAGAGSQRLFEAMLAETGVALPDLVPPARTEADAVLAVIEGKGDAAFGLRALAEQHRLRFVPVIEERFDLLVDRRAWFEPPMQAFLAFCRSDAFRARAGEMAGYDVGRLGEVRFNAE